MVKQASALFLLLVAGCAPAMHVNVPAPTSASRPLIVASVVPVEGDSGDTVLITGYGFTTPRDTTIAFGGATALFVDVIDEHRMEVVVPRGKGTVDVCITNSNGSWIALTGYAYSESIAPLGPDGAAPRTPEDADVVTFCFPEA